MMRGDDTADIAEAILQFRRTRSSFLPREIFSEPAWDLLLELFLADAAGRRLSAREVGERSDVPLNVLSRWLMHLTKTGFVVGDGEGDIDDLLTLSATGIGKMEQLLVQARSMHDKLASAKP